MYTCKFSCLLVFSVIEMLLFNRKKQKKMKNMHGKSVKVEITKYNITPVLQIILDFIYIQISLAFNMFSTLMLVEVKLSGI